MYLIRTKEQRLALVLDARDIRKKDKHIAVCNICKKLKVSQNKLMEYEQEFGYTQIKPAIRKLHDFDEKLKLQRDIELGLLNNEDSQLWHKVFFIIAGRMA